VVHLGYDETVFEPSVVSARTNRLIAEKYGLQEPYFLHVGVLQPRKNLVRLIDAFVQTIREEPLCKASLVIVGKNGWKYEEILRRARAEDTKGRVVVLNAVPSEDLPILYKCCLALVFPSLYEGFGLPLLEAMACGTPVACSRTSSLPEIAGEAAIFFDPLSVEQISRMMIQLWKEPNLRATMIEKGIQRARNFSWNKTARETISVLDEVAD
jgi:glycosyltransferase involved in cell wall biosynthesis